MQRKWSSKDKIYLILTIYIMGRRNQIRELRKLREWKTEKIRESKKFLFCLGMHIIRWEVFL